MRLNKGFTLIELVVVIVILGILAATALPKFVDLGKDARIAALNGLKAALETGAREGQALCVMTPQTCSVSAGASSQSELTGNYVVRNGVTYRYSYGYPIAWEDVWTNGDKGIGAFVDYTGFTRPAYINATGEAVFTKDGAPNPSKCKVIYRLTGHPSSGGLVTTSIVADEC